MICIEPWTWVAGAFWILVLPFPWLLAAVTAAAFHELCHIAAIHALGGKVLTLRIGPYGAVLESILPGRGGEALAALAGPLGSFLLASFYRWLPHTALCAFIQGSFNLLPLYPMDGGRALRRLLEGRLSGKVVSAVEGLLMGLAALAALRFSTVFACLLVVRWIFGKIPCKEGKIGVQ